jgi:two-component system phosphate regulon response regulator PhoB
MIPEAGNYVLVVDDDSDLRESLEIMLQLSGYQVASVSDASQALSWLQSSSLHPSVILLDFMMPGMNGVEFSMQLTSDTALAEIPIVFITGAEAALDKAMTAPSARVLGKPFDLQELLTVVREFCPTSCSGDAPFSPKDP